MAEESLVSCHLRSEDEDAVSRALSRLAGTAGPMPVWPPRPLPPGILLSPPRNAGEWPTS